VNVSLDTLKPERFKNVCRGSHEGAEINNVLSGIAAAREAGLNPVKINVWSWREKTTTRYWISPGKPSTKSGTSASSS